MRHERGGAVAVPGSALTMTAWGTKSTMDRKSTYRLSPAGPGAGAEPESRVGGYRPSLRTGKEAGSRAVGRGAVGSC
ncbi:hypothetical protein Sru01_56100 [Sphaerisporangium rufum]|uniref:Uncharacterized protein n=1 Tax=Sphaerisporangium rufum TaxID=1381558 RepID=A0A919R7E6_9ACTN|nr:hypothetical protein Sru01_56100 [Sphaerisporangium rufum]